MLIAQFIIILVGLALAVPILVVGFAVGERIIGRKWAGVLKTYHIGTILVICCLLMLTDSDVRYFGLKDAINGASSNFFVATLEILVAAYFGPVLFAWMMLLGVGIFILGSLLTQIFPSANELAIVQLFTELYATATPITWLLVMSLALWMALQFNNDPKSPKG